MRHCASGMYSARHTQARYVRMCDAILSYCSVCGGPPGWDVLYGEPGINVVQRLV